MKRRLLDELSYQMSRLLLAFLCVALLWLLLPWLMRQMAQATIKANNQIIQEHLQKKKSQNKP